MAQRQKDQTRYPDSVQTQNLGLVRLTELEPDEKIKIAGHWVKAADIPLNAVFLSCGHPMRGIALELNNVVFCETCKENVFVAEVN